MVLMVNKDKAQVHDIITKNHATEIILKKQTLLNIREWICIHRVIRQRLNAANRRFFALTSVFMSRNISQKQQTDIV